MAYSLKGFIFDLDGVITETAKFHYIAWKEIVKQIGINLSEEVNEKIKGLPRKETLLEILKIYDVKLNDELINNLCVEKNNYYLELLNNNLNESDILDGIHNLLIDAKNDGIKLAIASSSLNAKMILNKLNILDLFDYIVDSSKIKNGKPSPDIYLDAAFGLKLDPRECIGFEDAMVGIIGLNKAKIFSIGINKNDLSVKDNSKLFFNSTSELNYKRIKNDFIRNREFNMNILFVSDKNNSLFKKRLISEIRKLNWAKELNFIDINDEKETNIVDDTIYAINYAKNNFDNFKLIIIDDFGSSSFMVASKFKNCIVAQLEDEHSARMTRDHNNTNIICIGTYNVGFGLSYNIVKKFIKSEYSGGRHQVRIDMLDKLLEKEEN